MSFVSLLIINFKAILVGGEKPGFYQPTSLHHPKITKNPVSEISGF